VPTRAGQAIALAVHLKVPLLVAEALLGTPTPPDDLTVLPETPAEVPEVFLRAFDE
jgi:hypothetical protein